MPVFLNKNGLQILEIENLDRKKNFILNCFTEYFSSEFKISFFHHWYALLGKDAANTYHYLLKTVTSRCSIRQVSCSVQCSRSVASDSLRLFGLQHTRFCSWKIEIYTVSKNKTRSLLWLRSWTPLLPNSDLNWKK